MLGKHHRIVVTTVVSVLVANALALWAVHSAPQAVASVAPAPAPSYDVPLALRMVYPDGPALGLPDDAPNVYVPPPPTPSPSPQRAVAANLAPEPRVAATRLSVEPAPAPGPRYAPVSALRAAALEAGFPEPDRVVRVAQCESGVDLDHDGYKEAVDLLATGSLGERGPLQLLPAHALYDVYGRPGAVLRAGYSWAQMYELVPNVRAAFVVWSDAGGSFRPWSCPG